MYVYHLFMSAFHYQLCATQTDNMYCLDEALKLQGLQDGLVTTV